MKRGQINLTFILILLVSAYGASGSLGSDVDFDFIAGKLNGKSLDGLTIESATDLLGRPEIVTPPTKGESVKFGACLYYQSKGIALFFRHPEQDPQQGFNQMYVYLAPMVEDDYGNRPRCAFSPFTGKLSKHVDANWKLSKFLEEFKNEGVTNRTDQAFIDAQQAFVERQKKTLAEMEEIAARGRIPNAKARQDDVKRGIERFERAINNDYCNALIELPRFLVQAYFDMTTKYLNRISILVTKPESDAGKN